MKNIFKFTALGAVALMISGTAHQADAGQQHKVWVTIYRVRQIDDLDPSTPVVTKDRADFYTQITIDGQEYTSPVMSADDGKPGWTFEVSTSKTKVPVRIKMIDDDGALERKDDYVDISPKNSKKDLDMTMNTSSRRVSGDVSGKSGARFHTKGASDSDKAEVWFTVKSS
jgi:hypothetical protein